MASRGGIRKLMPNVLIGNLFADVGNSKKNYYFCVNKLKKQFA